MKISKHLLFQHLNLEHLKLIEQHSLTRSYPKGAMIHFEDDVCDGLEFVNKGSIVIEHLMLDGTSKIIKKYAAGKVFGLNLLYATNKRYLMNVVAGEDVTITKLDKKLIDLFFANDAIFRNQFVQLISDNSRLFGYKVSHLDSLTIKEKILHYIDQQSEKQKTDVVKFHISKTDLARMFGVARSSLSRELKSMQEEGLIKFDFKTIQKVK